MVSIDVINRHIYFLGRFSLLHGRVIHRGKEMLLFHSRVLCGRVVFNL